MADIPNATATVGASGYTCPTCGQWVSSYATAVHVCQRHATFWPQPPPTPLFPDPRLLALQEQIAKALERIADALEGLKKPAICGQLYGGEHKWICTLPWGHSPVVGHGEVVP